MCSGTIKKKKSNNIYSSFYPVVTNTLIISKLLLCPITLNDVIKNTTKCNQSE